MVTIQHSIDIDATPQQVWEVVADLDGYASWNPFMIRGRGRFAVGERLEITMRPGDRTMTFRPTVLEAEPRRRVRWLGRLVLPRVFDGEHVLELEALEDGRTRFTQHERFRGVLVPLLGRMLGETEAAFAAMNAALKAIVEATARAEAPASEAAIADAAA
jgi:hypothetical protein